MEVTEETRLLGIDVSDNNRALYWPTLALKADFAIIKATENDDYRSLTLEEQDEGAREAGVEVGYYHFAQPDKAAPIEQAQFFVANLAGRAGDGNPLALDIERGGGDLTEWVLTFARAVGAMTGRLPSLYTSPAFAAEHLRDDARLRDVDLWLASWGSRQLRVPKPWDAAMLWQWTSRWRIPGATLDLDGDEFLGGGRQEFRDLGVMMGTKDLAYVRRFLRESAVTLDGWANELEANTMDDTRRRQVAAEMDDRAGEARELAGDTSAD